MLPECFQELQHRVKGEGEISKEAAEPIPYNS